MPATVMMTGTVERAPGGDDDDTEPSDANRASARHEPGHDDDASPARVTRRRRNHSSTREPRSSRPVSGVLVMNDRPEPQPQPRRRVHHRSRRH